MINGVLIVDKPAGLTSHDVVDQVRRLTGIRRIGHTGTLDPMATGVLGILLGPATRLAQFATASEKQYWAILRLGQTTDTYDADGRVVDEKRVDVDLEAIHSVLPRFRGAIAQLPPMVSAIRVNGKRLYEHARQGEEIQRTPRPVTISKLAILDWTSPDLTFEVSCSAGTYIRSLAHDIGQTLGCGGHLRALRRTASGPFRIEQSHSLDDLEQMRTQGRLLTALLPPAAALGSMPGVVASADQERAIRFGQVVSPVTPFTSDLIQAHDANGDLIAVLRRVDDGTYRPVVVLPPSDD